MQLSALGRIVSQQVTIDDLQANLDSLERRERSVRAQIAVISARLESETLDAATRAQLESRLQTLRSELRAAPPRHRCDERRGAHGDDSADGRHAWRPRGRPGALAARPDAGRGAQRPRLGRRRRAGDRDRRRAVRARSSPRPGSDAGSTGGGKRNGCSRRNASGSGFSLTPLRRPQRRDQRLGDDLERPPGDLARLAESRERLLLAQPFALHEDSLRPLDLLPASSASARESASSRNAASSACRARAVSIAGSRSLSRNGLTR